MARFLRILGWSAGVVLCLVVVSAGALYLFLTSDYLRGELEGRASDYTGRKTKVADFSIEWGSTARVRLQGVEIANAATDGHVIVDAVQWLPVKK